MKKLRVIILILFILPILFGCERKEEKTKILIPDGIPCIALGSLFEMEEYDFTVVNGSNVLASELIKDEYDVIVAPIVLGAQLYSKNTSNYQLKSIITTGNSYVVFREEDNIESLKDLEGKTIASFGQNTAPDIILKAALEIENVDINKVEIVYENSVADVLSNRFLAGDKTKYILCAEPVISKLEITLKSKVGNIQKIDLQSIVTGKNDLDFLPQAGLFVHKDIDNEAIEKLAENIKNNIDYLNQNPVKYSEKIMLIDNENLATIKQLGKEIITNSIPNSNMVFLDAKANDKTIKNYLNLINKYNDKIIEKDAIDEEFYKK